MTSSLALLTLARLRMFFREPSALFWTFGFPILLTVALGIAFRSRPPEPVEVAVEQGPGGEEARSALSTSADVRAVLLPEAQARAALRVGRVQLVVRPGSPPVYEYDPMRPQSRLARALVDDALQRAAGRADPLAPRDAIVAEPGSRYVDFLVPGLIGLNLMSSGMWGIGWAIVETRQKKLLKRMLATPMRRGEFLFSFVLMRMVFLLMEVPVLVAFGNLAFGVPVRGSLATLGAVALSGSLAFAGLGLLVASRARNTQTVNGLINVVMMPMFLLSGVFFSSAHFPALMQPLVQALPLTALNDALRAVMNEGAGALAVAPQVGYLAAFAAVAFGAALRLFRWS